MPPIRIETPSGPIFIDPVSGDIVAAPPAATDPTTAPVDSNNPYANYPPHGGLAGPSAGTTQSALGTTPAAAPKAAPRITNVTNLGGGNYQYEYADGTYEIVDSTPSSGGGGATAGQALQSQAAAASLAEQQRQFDLTQGERKARGDQEMRLAQDRFGEDKRQFDASQQLNRGNTLLGLGSRPDTLIKYLYALQGQQTPQGLMNTTANLPGYQNVIGRTNYGTAPGAAPALGGQGNPANPYAGTNTNFGGSPTTADTAIINGVKVWAGGPYSGKPVASTPANAGDLTPYLQNPGLAPAPVQVQQPPPSMMPVASGGTNITSTAPTGAPVSQQSEQDALIASGRTPKFYSNGVAIFKDGGPIPEPVIGVGMKSGKTYKFGEEGPEFVISHDKLPEFMKFLGKNVKDNHGSEDMMGNKSYASGGTIDYSQTPTLGQNSSGFFNDPNLKTAVGRGYNSNPGVPLFPQVGIATGGGSSLVPSAQRLSSLLPSEQSLYAGTLQDEFGAQPEDVFAMARKLAPNVTGLRTPRYAA